MKYIVGNWKSNKNSREFHSWIKTFTSYNLGVLKNNVEVIIAPPFPFISEMKSLLQDYPWVKIASQDISEFGAGSYTGAVSSHNLDGLVDYCIIGHSERRTYFHETSELVVRKASLASTSNIEPIVCVRGSEDVIPPHVRFVAFEPVAAIGSGHGESPEHVLDMAKRLNLKADSVYIYGGSVRQSNAHDYLQHSEIQGILPGGASLDPKEFYDICLEAYVTEQKQ